MVAVETRTRLSWSSLSRREGGGRDLVEQRLEQAVVVPVHQGDRNRRAA